MFLVFLTKALILKQFEASIIFPLTKPFCVSNIKSLLKRALLLAWTFELNLNSLSIFFNANDSMLEKIFKDTVWNSKY